MGELPFLEVGIHVDVLNRNDGHQRDTHLDFLADLNGSLGNDAVDRCAQNGTRQIDSCLFGSCLCL